VKTEQTTSTTTSVDVDEDAPTKGLKNITEQTSLKWIFVGGKGGVGKTTTSCSLAVQLSKVRRNVLLISTDPAHNLSDAFGQKFGKTATQVSGFKNLFAMEIDPTVELETGDVVDTQTKSIIADLASTLPGIDEAMSFAELMKQVQTMNYDVIVFDTAPTGHTLRLLSFPSVLEKAFQKFMAVKSKFSGIFKQVSGMMGPNAEEKVATKLEQTKQTIDIINKQFKNPEATTFVCVCIPEFLSVFETERLVVELAKFKIDTHNIVVNQVLMPEKDSTCRKCSARVKMQKKYLEQISELYEDFNVTLMPLLDEEVRGVESLEQFSKLLVEPVTSDYQAAAAQAASPAANTPAPASAAAAAPTKA